MPQSRGEIQTAIHELALLLMERSETVAVLCGLSGEGILGLRARVLMKALGRRSVFDTRLGYRAHRAASVTEAAGEVVLHEKPDVSLVYANELESVIPALHQLGVPVVISIRAVDLHRPVEAFRKLPCDHYISDCSFTARRLLEEFGISSRVIHPVVLPDLHRVISTRETVTIFDPALDGAGEIGLRAAARCNEIPFVFAEYAPLDDPQRTMLLDAMRGLPNARFTSISELSQEVLMRTRFLLVPGSADQGFNRIIAEAQVSGIPVIAAKQASVSEAVGPGGILVERDASIDAWVEAIRRLWSDERYYADLSAKALEHARRPQLDPQQQAGQILEILQAAIDAHAAGNNLTNLNPNG